MKFVICNLQSKNALGRIAKPITAMWVTVAAVLREIFDENAYARFLQREQVGVSRESYGAFQREMARRRERRARCC